MATPFLERMRQLPTPTVGRTKKEVMWNMKEPHGTVSQSVTDFIRVTKPIEMVVQACACSVA